MKDEIYLEGLVLHSPDIDALRAFYEALLGIKFNEKKHEDGRRHYLGQHGDGVFIDLYPSREASRSPHLIMNVSDLEGMLKRVSAFTQNKVEPIPPLGAIICDPDGRLIYLHRRS